MAICTSPEVPFLKPTGQETPETRARADRSPTDQPGNVLRRNHVQELGSRGHAHLGQIEQQPPRQPQAVVDLVRLIQIGVIDQPLPSNGGAGLLEVHPHHQAQLGGKLRHRRLQQGRVLARRLGVVNRAGTGQNDQPLITPVENLGDLLAGVKDGRRGAVGDGQLFLKKDRGKNHLGPLNVNVFCGVEHGHFPFGAHLCFGAAATDEINTPTFKSTSWQRR
jgi:hypothetical protein